MTYEAAVATAFMKAREVHLHHGFAIDIAVLALRRLRVRAGLVP